MIDKKHKRIGIDARLYGPQNKGLGRYVKEVTDGVIKADPENEYVVFLRRDNFDDFIPSRSGVTKVLADIRWYTLKEQVLFPFLLWRARLDLVHFPHFNVPLFYPGRFVVTIHDLILTKYPTQRASTLSPWVYRAKNLAYRLTIGRALKRARQVIAISEFTKQDIVSQFGTDPAKIRVIYEGVAESVKTGDIANDKQIVLGYNIHSPYLLYVGNAYPHKNLEELIAILPEVRKNSPETSLVLVGKDDYFYSRLKAYAANCPARDAIIFPGFVPDQDLAAFYRQALAYVFPSRYEGFGLPPLEAMQHGCPVASSRSSALPEVLGDAAIYFEPGDRSGMLQSIARAISDQPFRESIRQKGFERVARYSWRDCARSTLAIYGSVIREYP